MHSQTDTHKPLSDYRAIALYYPYKLLIFLPTLLISTAILGSLIVALVSLGLTRLAHKVPITWARINAKAALCPVNLTGTDQINPGQSYIVVANHRSHFDVLAIYGWLPVPIRWVIKQELRQIPVLGLACEKLGHIFVNRRNRQQAQQSITQAKRQLVDGTSVFFFPEGTRSEGQLLSFKKGAFHLAKQLGLPILPISIEGSQRVLPARSLNLQPGTISLHIHAPITSTDKTIEQLSDAARQAILSGLTD